MILIDQTSTGMILIDQTSTVMILIDQTSTGIHSMTVDTNANDKEIQTIIMEIGRTNSNLWLTDKRKQSTRYIVLTTIIIKNAHGISGH